MIERGTRHMSDPNRDRRVILDDDDHPFGRSPDRSPWAGLIIIGLFLLGGVLWYGIIRGLVWMVRG